MLRAVQKAKLQEINFLKCTCIEKDGKPVDYNGNPFVVPSFLEIREEIFRQIHTKGFSKIEFVKPSKANCVIRVYKLVHYAYSDTLIYNAYGGCCYTLKNKKWISAPKGHEIELDYPKCTIRRWLCQDEYVDLNFDFFDCYVKVS